MERRIVVETFCEHGMTAPHAVYESVMKAHNRAAGKPIPPSSIETCPGGSRRVLTEGQYVLIEKVDGEWPEWATNELAAFTAWGADPDLDQILDALSDHTEGTP